jgi:tetratricopeptide (TPR) repeat protein
MKFFKSNFIVIILSGLLLSACSSFNQQKTTDDKLATQTSTSKSSVELTDTRDPWQQKAIELQALPNEYLTQGTKLVIPPAVQSQFEQGIALIKQQKLREANRLYVNLSQQYGNLSGVWVQLADIALLQGEQQQAMDYLQQALSANQLNYVAHNGLALLYRQQGKFNLALQHYNLALESWPAFAQARLNRGILHDLYLGNKSQALEDYSLYQALLAKPERQVIGWIADLERQVQSQEKADNATSGTLKGEFK